MSYKLTKLEYKYNALEPFIDGRTMEIHHSKHHASYLNKFNAAIKNTALEKMSPTAIFAEISKYNNSIRNNGGGFFNHALFWQVLAPPQTEEKIEPELAEAIATNFGSITNFKKLFSEAAATQFGSGWAWLIKRDDETLVVTSTPNQDNPLMDINPVRGIPILCLDVWEHAYYLKYQNKRPEYIEAFWNVVNWKKVSELYKRNLSTVQSKIEYNEELS